jgi:hypothetical protein
VYVSYDHDNDDGNGSNNNIATTTATTISERGLGANERKENNDYETGSDIVIYVVTSLDGLIVSETPFLYTIS